MKTNLYGMLLAGLLILLGGCAAGPNYHPPQAAAPANWNEPLLGGTTNSTGQVSEWWMTFNDPELDSLIQRAVKANYDLRLALGRLHEARATRAGAVADFGPTVGTSAGYTRERLSKNNQQFFFPGQKFDYDNYDAHFDATWEIDIFGSKRCWLRPRPPCQRLRPQ